MSTSIECFAHRTPSVLANGVSWGLLASFVLSLGVTDSYPGSMVTIVETTGIVIAGIAIRVVASHVEKTVARTELAGEQKYPLSGRGMVYRSRRL